MSSIIRNDIICNSNPDIMEYLILKLESRQRNLAKCANIFNEIDSFESFYQKRKDIFNLFQNLEEELKQAALAIKALLTQNKALSHESINSNNIQKDYKKLLLENNYLMKENNNYAQKLKNLKINDKIVIRGKSPTFGRITKTKNDYINKSKNRYEPAKKVNDKKKSNYNMNINKRYNKINNRSKDKNYELDLDDIEQLKNVKNIIKDRKNNKNKLREVIDEHFKNQTEGNIRNVDFKNI